MTAFTPGIFSAALASMLSICAWACGLRRMRPSSRVWGLPRIRQSEGFFHPAISLRSLHLFRRGEGGLKDPRVGAAATNVAGAGFLYLCECGIGVPLEQGGAGDDEAGSAEAAH